MTKHTILIMIAMQGEADTIIQTLSLVKDESDELSTLLNANVFKNDQGITLLTFGQDKRFGIDAVGTQRAALLTYAAIKGLRPSLIINAGTAGGFSSQGAEIGDVYACTNTVYHDRRINLPKFKEYGVGGFTCHAPDELTTHGFKFGILSTGNALDTSSTDMEHIQHSGASIKDMEGAAIAEIAEQMGVKYLGIKSVTDIVDTDQHTAEEQFLKNFSLATKNLTTKTLQVLQLMT